LQQTGLLLILSTYCSVDYEEYYKIRDAVCHRFIFCDFSGQTRLYPILSGMEKEVLKNRLHEVYGCCGFGS
jgi:hypothetical protein